MRKSNYNIPSSKALHALEATVRLGMVKSAAEELFVTQAAISHHIKKLEELLGTVLFIRSGGILTPTPAAINLATAVQNSSLILKSALDSIKGHSTKEVLTISMLPALASKWLAPHLADVMKYMPQTNLKIMASRNFVEFQRERVDAAIRYGLGNWPHVNSLHLTNEIVTPVMAPSLASQLDLESNNALSEANLLKCDNPNTWEDWFNGSDLLQPIDPTAYYFDDDATMIEAAIAGHGIALGRFALVAHDLRTGRLVAPFRHKIISKFGYWFVQDPRVPSRKETLNFFQWARTQLQHDAK